MKKKNKHMTKKKGFVFVLVITLLLAQGTFAQAANDHGVLRAAAYQGNSSFNTGFYGGSTLNVYAACYGTTASGSAHASGNLQAVDGCEYEFFDMDGYHETGRLVDYANGDDYASWSESNWFTDKTVAYSGINY